MSRTTARASTMTPAPPSACTKRSAISPSTDCAKAQPMLAKPYSTSAVSNTGLRPIRSEIGP